MSDASEALRLRPEREWDGGSGANQETDRLKWAGHGAESQRNMLINQARDDSWVEYPSAFCSILLLASC